MLQDDDLTPLERALCSAAATGRLLDGRCRHPDEDDPARGRTWGKNRQIRAQVLRQLLTGEGCLDQTFGRPLAVRLRGVSVSGRLNLGGLTARCPLELYGCYLGGRLDLAKAEASDISLRGSHLAQRLSARRLRLKDDLNLTGGFRCHGRVDLRDGHMGGSLKCIGATLSNPGGRALTADRLTVDGSLLLDSAKVTGEVRLLGAHVGGQFACAGATLSNSGGRALNADRLTVDGSLFLDGAKVTGEVRLLGAHVGGQFACAGATLSNSGGRALNADGLTVDGSLLLDGAKVTGEVRLLGAHVGGQLACAGATLSNSGGEALTADRLTVDGSLFLDSAVVTGEVRLLGAHVGGQLACVGATLSNPGGRALDLERALVAGPVYMRPARFDGSIDLTAARVGGWYDDRRTWPAALKLEGFVYEAIGPPAVTPKQRLGWLRRHQDGYLPQPYEQLASVYRQAGNDQAARTVVIAKQQARRAHARRWWVRAPSRAWSFILRWTIGYGYRPALALPYLAGLFVIGWVVFGHAYPTELRPAKSGPEQPGFNPARYTLDLLLPVANLHQRDAFVPHGYAAWWAFGLTLAGWLLAAIVVAGLTGVFKRD